MPAVYEHLHCVGSDEVNEYDHADNLAYLKWMLAAAVAHSEAQGWSWREYKQLGLSWVVRKHEIEYHREAFEGDQIVVRTWVSTMDKITSWRKYEIRRAEGNALLAKAATRWALVNLATGKPTRVPPELARSFEVVEGSPARKSV